MFIADAGGDGVGEQDEENEPPPIQPVIGAYWVLATPKATEAFVRLKRAEIEAPSGFANGGSPADPSESGWASVAPTGARAERLSSAVAKCPSWFSTWSSCSRSLTDIWFGSVVAR